MNKLELTKNLAATVVGIGASTIVKAIIRNNVYTKSAVDIVTVAAATFVIGSMVTDATKKYLDAKIDEAVAWYASINTKQD